MFYVPFSFSGAASFFAPMEAILRKLDYCLKAVILVLFLFCLNFGIGNSIVAKAADGSTTVYITEYGEKYHSSSCQYLHESKISISLSSAVKSGYSPCSVCNPPRLTSSNNSNSYSPSYSSKGDKTDDSWLGIFWAVILFGVICVVVIKFIRDERKEKKQGQVMLKSCCFIGHRKINKTEELTAFLKSTIIELIEEKEVRLFLFGSRSEFDDLCHSIITDLRKEYPDIQRVLFGCESETAPNKEEKELSERYLKRVYGKDIVVKDYDDFYKPEEVFTAGKLSYVVRNQAMIDESDYCVFYYDKNYQPPRRKLSKNSLGTVQPNSGTRIAYEYACKKAKNVQNKQIINIFEGIDDEKV